MLHWLNEELDMKDDLGLGMKDDLGLDMKDDLGLGMKDDLGLDLDLEMSQDKAQMLLGRESSECKFKSQIKSQIKSQTTISQSQSHTTLIYCDSWLVIPGCISLCVCALLYIDLTAIGNLLGDMDVGNVMRDTEEELASAGRFLFRSSLSPTVGATIKTE